MSRPCKMDDNNKNDLEEVMTFDVVFTGMTEEDFAFLRAYAEEQRKQKRL